MVATLVAVTLVAAVVATAVLVATAEAVVAATGAVAWLNLLPAPSAEEFPLAALEARGVATRAVLATSPPGWPRGAR